MAKTLLALDVATTTGWAFGEVGGKPVADALRFGGARVLEHDDLWAEALKWLNDLLAVNQPDIVALEAPIHSSSIGGGSNPKTMMLLTGLQAVMRTTVALRRPSLAQLVHVQSARKLFIGKGNLKGDVAKKLVKTRCIELGWISSSDATYDKTDAMCVWAFAAAQADPSVKAYFTGLGEPKAAKSKILELKEW